jgi:hypothetical protein
MAKEFYAVFVKSSYRVPGDERSRTNPGHGYPEHDVDCTEVIEFGTLEELKAWVERNGNGYGSKKFRAAKCHLLEVSIRLDVDVA